jgi:hypothetical protein
MENRSRSNLLAGVILSLTGLLTLLGLLVLIGRLA